MAISSKTNKVSLSPKSTLPTIDKKTSRYIPPKGFSSPTLYSPIDTLYRQGPIPLFVRLTDPDKYEQSILRYMLEARTNNIKEAQGNMDAFFASPDDWAEQKIQEQKGLRDIFDYSKDPSFEKVVLSTIWGIFIIGLLGRVLWQLIHGQRNLF